MLNIVRPDAATRVALADAINFAVEKGTGFRICTGSDDHGHWVKWDAGAGWTPPYYGVTL